MVGLDADKLALLQGKWKKIAASTPGQFSKNLDQFEDIIIGLRELGLHTAYDSTYDLLSPGLDREQFRHKRTEMFLLQALNTYHNARRITDDHPAGDANKRRQKSLRQLLIFDLPAYESHVASSGLADTLSPLLVEEIKGLCTLKKSGALAEALLSVNAECVKDAFRKAYGMNADQQNDLAKAGVPHVRATKIALAHAETAVKGLDELGTRLIPGEIPLARDSAGYWTDKRVTFDRATVVGVRDSLLLRSCRIAFHDAVAHQDGEALGAGALPIQGIVQTLVAHKYNMVVPSTFAAMGTTRDAFWAAYRRERQAVAADPLHADRLAPEFKPA